MRPVDSQTSLWLKFGAGVRGIEQVIKKVGKVLDDMHSERNDSGDGVPKQLQATMRLLQGCTSAMIMGQWKPLDATLRRILEEQVPRIMVHLNVHGMLQSHVSVLLDRLRDDAHGKLQASDRGLQALLPEVDLILIRVQSCYDFDGESRDSSRDN